MPTTRLLSNIAMLRTACVAIGIPIVYTAQDPEERALLTDFWGAGLSADPRQAAMTRF